MKLNWFSPLPPAKSGIADFTAHVLPALREHGEVVLWTDQVQWDQHLEIYAPVRSYQPDHIPWEELNRAAITIYHIGNNPFFHAPIWQVSRHHPGIVVLHDTCLQHFFAGIYRMRWQDYDGYRVLMRRYYGQEGEVAAKQFWDGLLATEFLAERYPLTPLALENALGGVVHTREPFRSLRKENRWPVAHLPLPYPASPYTGQALAGMEAKRSVAPPYRLVVAGYIGLNRRLDSLLQALAGFPEKEKFRLDVYGELWDAQDVVARVRALGLTEAVTLHGFVPEQKLNTALEAAHLAINLRYPTMGEASASQLRFWDYALPTLVTKVGWYAELPETVVGFVRPEYEVMDLQTHFAAFLAGPDHFAEMGRAGRRLLEAYHTPEGYVRALVQFVPEVQRFRAHATAYDLSKRVAVEMRSWANVTTTGDGIRRTAEAIYALACAEGIPQVREEARRGDRL